MAISITQSSVQIGSFSLQEGASGVVFTGSVDAFAFNSDPPISPLYGTVAGYTSGGGGYSPPSPYLRNTIDKFPFASNANATDVGDLTQTREGSAGQSSTTHGYTSGGATPTLVNTIDRFPFASNANATDVGDITRTVWRLAGQSSNVSGYSSGGDPATNTIDKFPFASNANATDVGDLTRGVGSGPAGQSSTTDGYTSGGQSSNIIDKFPFASNANATDVGDLTIDKNRIAGQSSTTHGYTSGGYRAWPGPLVGASNVIDRFSFATNSHAADVGDLTVARTDVIGQSSTVSGYTSGGDPGVFNIIDKFPFASNANATDVGDLSVRRYRAAGQQD